MANPVLATPKLRFQAVFNAQRRMDERQAQNPAALSAAGVMAADAGGEQVNVYQSDQYWATQPPSDHAMQMQFEVRLAFLLTLTVFSFPLGTAGIVLLTLLPEWLLPQHGTPNNLYLAVVALLSTLGFYVQWYILLPRLLHRWKNWRNKAA